MIREWLTYLRTPSRPEVRQLGYVHEAIAIRERHTRHREAWEPHLRRSRDFILAAADRCAECRSCVILGSGLLLDVPLDSLAGKFDQVALVDIVHLPETKRQAARYENVRLIECDVTGLTDSWKTNPDAFKGALPPPAPPSDLLTEKADLAVSLNLLSQLPLNLVEAVAEKYSTPQAESERWSQDIQENHWQWLRSLARIRCIITDTQHITRARSGDPIDTTDFYSPQAKPKPNATWEWQLAPTGEIAPDHSVSATVCGWIISEP